MMVGPEWRIVGADQPFVGPQILQSVSHRRAVNGAGLPDGAGQQLDQFIRMGSSYR